MPRRPTRIELSPEDKHELLDCVRSAAAQQRLAERARIILLAAEGKSTHEIARTVKTRPARVSTWRRRFAEAGVAGLSDAARPGKPPSYGHVTTRRILRQLVQPPPPGHKGWTSHLIAEALGNVSADQVWRVLRQKGIRLRRSGGALISTAPEFVPATSDLLGLYLDARIMSAVVLATSHQAPSTPLISAPGFLRLPNAQAAAALGGAKLPLADALDRCAQLVQTGRYVSARERTFELFFQDLVAICGGLSIYVVFTSAGGRPNVAWLGARADVQVHGAPSLRCWINEVECWFNILSETRPDLEHDSAARLCRSIEHFLTAAAGHESAPFEWRKQPGGLE